jgi:1,4-alpha-glucan branching enzyme
VDRDENPLRPNGLGTVDACPPDPSTVDRVLGGAHHDPHSVLGAHPHPDGTVVRVLRPHADEVHVVREGGEGHPLVRVHDAGLFSGVVPGPPADYRLAVRYGERVDVVDDPYRWLPTLGAVDLHLIGEGRHERLWDVLGAHVRSYETPAGTVTGTSFAVWAPTAQGVRVTGDFDGWAGWTHPMRVLGGSGVWELFVPGVGTGTHYKFRVLGRDGRWRDKADPMAFRSEVPPATASVVDVDRHEWADAEWMAARARKQAHAEPMSVYEVHLGSWRQGLTYKEAAEQLVAYLDETGFTHVELLPVAEHPFGGSWGYQVTSYYAPTARFGTPDDFRWFVDHLHQHGYGVIVDWVPAHFPRDEWALARFDGSPLYEHADPRRGEQPDWGTLVFDFGRTEVRNFLVANALYWLESFHVDGLRVDAVASMLYLDYSRKDGQWLPNVHGGRENLDAVAFLQEMNATVYREHPGVVTIAEESTAWPGVSRPTHLGGLGFGFKWNMGWMHDTLDYTGRDPIYRGYHHNQMTFSLMYAFSENYVLPISHDEVVHGKGSLWERMPGDRWNKAANIRALLAFMWAHPGKQLLFMGQEFGQAREWSEQRSLDWESLADPLHGGIKTMVGDMNRAYRAHPALWTRDVSPEGFSWIDANDTAGNVFSFLRHGVDADGKPTVLACVANFSGSAREDYRVGLPFAGRWREVLNTDAEAYGGSGVGNLGAVEAEQHVWHGRPASARLRLPPSGVLWLARSPSRARCVDRAPQRSTPPRSPPRARRSRSPTWRARSSTPPTWRAPTWRARTWSPPWSPRPGPPRTTSAPVRSRRAARPWPSRATAPDPGAWTRPSRRAPPTRSTPGRDRSPSRPRRSAATGTTRVPLSRTPGPRTRSRTPRTTSPQMTSPRTTRWSWRRRRSPRARRGWTRPHRRCPSPTPTTPCWTTVPAPRSATTSRSPRDPTRTARWGGPHRPIRATGPPPRCATRGTRRRDRGTRTAATASRPRGSRSTGTARRRRRGRRRVPTPRSRTPAPPPRRAAPRPGPGARRPGAAGRRARAA